MTYKEEVISWEPRISMFYDVITPGEAEMVKSRAYPKVRYTYTYTCTCTSGFDLKWVKNNGICDIIIGLIHAHNYASIGFSLVSRPPPIYRVL